VIKKSRERGEHIPRWAAEPEMMTMMMIDNNINNNNTFFIIFYETVLSSLWLFKG
jgi:hypothetical protein